MTAPGSTVVDRDARVHVIGSINADTILTVSAFPTPGTTVIAKDSHPSLGGKGAAQAIACARFGAQTRLTGSVGSDEEGRSARAVLSGHGVASDLVRESSLPTGRAYVYVDAHAENEIVVAQGANSDLNALTQDDRDAIAHAQVMLTQLEAGTAIAFEAIRTAADRGVTVILNAAPARDIPRDVLSRVDFLIVNEPEAVALCRDAPDATAAGEKLAEAAGTVLVTLGAQGGRVHRRGQAPQAVPALSVAPVDTTGAGDTACGVFAAAIAFGWEPEEAFRIALAAGSLSTTTQGNVPSIPDRDRILTAAAVHTRVVNRSAEERGGNP